MKLSSSNQSDAFYQILARQLQGGWTVVVAQTQSETSGGAWVSRGDDVFMEKSRAKLSTVAMEMCLTGCHVNN